VKSFSRWRQACLHLWFGPFSLLLHSGEGNVLEIFNVECGFAGFTSSLNNLHLLHQLGVFFYPNFPFQYSGHSFCMLLPCPISLNLTCSRDPSFYWPSKIFSALKPLVFVFEALPHSFGKTKRRSLRKQFKTNDSCSYLQPVDPPHPYVV